MQGSEDASEANVSGAPQPGQEAAARDLARKLFGGTQSSVGLVVAAIIGTAIGELLVRNYLVTLVVLVAYALMELGLYYWGTVRRWLGTLRRAPSRAEPAAAATQAVKPEDTAALQVAGSEDTAKSDGTAQQHRLAWRVRSGTAALTCILAACGYVLGYYVIGYGFARGPSRGILSLLLTLIVIAAVIAVARWWQHAWPPPWLRYRARTAMACCVVAGALSAGATLGSTNLVPPCPAPTELTVLTSQEDLGAIQAAIPGFEQYEPAHLHAVCYVVDVTAYAAPTDKAAWSSLARPWGPGALSTVGPRPDIWIPSSSAEVTEVRHSASNGPHLTGLGSIGSSPLVVAVPDDLANGSLARLKRLKQNTTWGSLYNALSRDGVGLAMPNPAVSETARLEIAGLYPALTSAEERLIETSGSFPPDSWNLLCDAAQTAEQRRSPPTTAYLVSDATLISNNADQLTKGACATLTKPPPPLTAFFPADGATLDFPFTAVNWGGNSAADKTRSRDENDFYHWLTGRASATLLKWGLRRPRCGKISKPSAGVVCRTANVPTKAEVASALASFQQAQAPAHILIGIDDSGPMQPYLPQITAAIDAELGPSGTHIGNGDSFGIWKLPGSRKGQIYQQLVRFGRAGAIKHQVPADVGVLTGHDHSANYDMLTDAAGLLYSQVPANPEPINSVILLTDGDGYPPGDPDGHSQVSVTRVFDVPPHGHSPIKLYIIAFGPYGCAESGTGAASQSMAALAVAAGGTCLQANGADPPQLLAQVLGQISTGG